MNLDLGVLRASDNKIDMSLQAIDGGSFYLGQTFFAYHRMVGSDTTSIQESVVDSTGTAEDRSGWKLQLGQLTMEDNALQYYDFTRTRVSDSFDPGHLWITGLQLSVEGIKVADDEYHAR